MHKKRPRNASLVPAIILSGIGLFFSGCHHQLQSPDTGKSSFTFVEPPPAKPRTATVAEPSDEPLVEEHFIEAEAIQPLATPAYPANALAAKVGLVTIGVRVTVDPEGRVSEISPSMLTFSTPTRYADEFEEAVRAALMTWRFHPAQRYRLRIFRSNEGGGPPKELERENTEASFDLAFTFTASGMVLPGSSTK